MAATQKDEYPLQGGCSCGTVRYELMTAPMIVHCCHCTWCQRETGSAFVLNALIESDNLITMSTTSPTLIYTPSASGAGQDVARCPTCYVALWSHFRSAGPLISFVRTGTLDNPAVLGEPDVFIYTDTKMPWVRLPEDGAKVFDIFYEREETFSQDAKERMQALWPRIVEYHEKKATEAGKLN